MKYAIEHAFRCHNKDWFKHAKVDGGIHRQHTDLISLIFYFQNKESRLKIPLLLMSPEC
jgi:hypothetical protein